MIEVTNMNFEYKKHKPVLQDISLRLQKGYIHGLLGKNGEGKSTLLKLIGGLLFPDSGEVIARGFVPSERKVDFLTDLFFLPEELQEINLTIDRFIQLNSVFYPKFSKADFESYLKDFEIEDTKQKMKNLSYGTKKKVLISFGLACHCEIMLFDEPTNGLDIPSKAQFRKVMLRAMNDETCVIISTHQVRDLHNLIDSVLILDSKNILLNASTEEICNKIYFGTSDKTIANEKILYSEDTLSGLHIVKENTENLESNLDIELLFNAVCSNKTRFRELFPQTDLTKGE